MQNIMIDIETLGTRPGCVILSIGAVEFDNERLGKELIVNIDPESCTDAGLAIEARTVMWWLDQSDEARKALTSRPTVALDKALALLNAAYDFKGKNVWCNGASFDFPILEAGYHAFGAKAPWEFWNTMDFRTLKNLIDTKTLKKIRAEIVSNYTAHDALGDAKEQALTVIGILSFLRGE